MANRITLSGTLSVAGSIGNPSTSASASADQSGHHYVENVQTIGFTDAEAIVIGDITTLGYILVKNTDATNYVELALDEPMTNKFAKLRPGEFCILPASVNAIYAQAAVAACDCLVLAVEL